MLKISIFNSAFLNQRIPFLVDTFPSLKVSLTAIVDEDSNRHGELVDELCNEVTVAKTGPEVMINIVRVKDEAPWTRYSKACTLSFFPVIQSEIWEMGTPKSDYWHQVTSQGDLQSRFPQSAIFCNFSKI